MVRGDLVETGVGEPRQVGSAQSVKEPVALLALSRNTDPVRLDLAVGQLEPALALARQPPSPLPVPGPGVYCRFAPNALTMPDCSKMPAASAWPGPTKPPWMRAPA